MSLCRRYSLNSFISKNRINGENRQRFKGSQPITFMYSHLEMLQNGKIQYSVNTKTDGERYFLYIDGKGKAYVVNKTLNKGFARMKSMANTPFVNTLIDGEIITRKNNTRLFIAYDIMYLGGNCVLESVYTERFKILARVVLNIKPYYTQLFKIQLQDTVHSKYAFTYGKDLLGAKKKYDTDGLIFYPNTPYIIGVEKSRYPILKWKPFHQNTIDFKMIFSEVRGDRVRYILLGPGNKPYNNYQASVENKRCMTESTFEIDYVRALSKTVNAKFFDRKIVECGFQETQYRPVAKEKHVTENSFKCVNISISEKYNLPEYTFTRGRGIYHCVQFKHWKVTPKQDQYYECVEDRERFVPYRLRPDKDRPNGFATMTDTINSIRKPVLLSDLYEPKSLFAKQIKRKANPLGYIVKMKKSKKMKIDEFINKTGKAVLNINPKKHSTKVYNKISAVKALALVESSRDISPLKELMKQDKQNKHIDIEYCNMTSGNLCLNNRTFDVVLGFGNIPFKSAKVLQDFLSNINAALTPGGYFIGSFIDADIISKQMSVRNTLNQVQINGTRYTKLYSNTNNIYNRVVGRIEESGQKINYVVFFKEFRKTLENLGLEIQHSQPMGVTRYFAFKKPEKALTYNNGYNELNYNVLYKLLYNGNKPDLKILKQKPINFKKGFQNKLDKVRNNVKKNKQIEAEKAKQAKKKKGPEGRVDDILKIFSNLSKTNFQKAKAVKKRQSARNWAWDQGKILKYERKIAKQKFNKPKPKPKTPENLHEPNNQNHNTPQNVNKSPNMTGRNTRLNALNLSKPDDLQARITRIYWSEIDTNANNTSVNQIKKVNSMELEARIGKFISDPKVRSGRKFVPGVSKGTFQNIIKYLKQQNMTKTDSMVFDLALPIGKSSQIRVSHKTSPGETYTNFIKKWEKRGKLAVHKTINGDIVDIVEKTKSSNTHDFKHTSNHEYDLRIQVSEENSVNSIVLKSLYPSFIRHKTRTTFVTGNGKVKVDMTIVKQGKADTIDNAPEVYEIEIEHESANNKPFQPNDGYENVMNEYFQEIERYKANPINQFVDIVNKVWNKLPRRENANTKLDNLPNNFDKIQFNWNKNVIMGNREYLQKKNHDGRKEMSTMLEQVGIEVASKANGLVAYKYNNRNGAPDEFILALAKWRELLLIERSLNGVNGKHGILKGRNELAILAAIVYNSIIVKSKLTLTHKQFIKKLGVSITMSQFIKALGIVQKYIPFPQIKNDMNTFILSLCMRVVSKLQEEQYDGAYDRIVSLYKGKYAGLTKRFKQILDTGLCKLSEPKEIVGVVFLELGVNKQHIVNILELTKAQESRMSKCVKAQYNDAVKSKSQPNKPANAKVNNKFKRTKNYRVTLRRINIGSVANYKTKIKQKISDAAWKKAGMFKLVQIKSVLMDRICGEKSNPTNILPNKLNQNNGKRAEKLNNSIREYVGNGKKFKTYDDMLDALLVLQKINLQVLYNDFVPSKEFWAFTYAGVKDDSNAGNKKKDAVVKYHDSRNKDIKLKKDDVDKIYKTFQNAGEMKMHFDNKDYIIRIFANGKCSVTLDGSKGEDFAIKLMRRFREYINSYSNAISQSERSIYYNKPMPLTSTEFEDTITNAMINAIIKTNNKYQTTADNVRGSIKLFNLLKKYDKVMVQKTHIGLGAKQAPLSISKNKAKVVFKMNGNGIEYSTDDNGGISILPGIITIQFNMTTNGSIEITARTYKDLDIANKFINSLFKNHAGDLFMKVATSKPNKPSNNGASKPNSTNKPNKPNKPSNNITNALFVNLPNIKNNAVYDLQNANNFKIINVNGDGHCLFRSIAVGLNHIKTNGAVPMSKTHELQVALKLRKIAANIICKDGGNKIVMNGDTQTYKQWVIGDLPNKFHNNYNLQKNVHQDVIFDTYCKQLKHGTLWGGQLEIQVLSEYLKIPMCVIDGETNGYYVFGDKYKSREPIFLMRINRNHYQALIVASQNSDNSNQYNNNNML